MKIGTPVYYDVHTTYDYGKKEHYIATVKGRIVKLDGSLATVKLTNGIVKKFNVSELKLADLEVV